MQLSHASEHQWQPVSRPPLRRKHTLPPYTNQIRANAHGKQHETGFGLRAIPEDLGMLADCSNGAFNQESPFMSWPRHASSRAAGRLRVAQTTTKHMACSTHTARIAVCITADMSAQCAEPQPTTDSNTTASKRSTALHSPAGRHLATLHAPAGRHSYHTRGASSRYSCLKPPLLSRPCFCNNSARTVCAGATRSTMKRGRARHTNS
jgi:hypothetical protein